jgi:hypothetical protein
MYDATELMPSFGFRWCRRLLDREIMVLVMHAVGVHFSCR